MTIYYEQHGSGPDIVLVHGWGMNGHVWGPTVKALSENYRVTVVDLPGHARSNNEVPDPFTLELLAETIVELVSPAIWIGWSLGGMVSMTAAQLWPDKIEGLVLVGSTPKFVQSDDWKDGIPPALLSTFASDLGKDYQKVITRFLSLQVGEDDDSRQLLRQLRKQIFQYPAPETDVLLAGLSLLRQSDLRMSLPEISQPTLVVHGGYDRLVPEAAARYLVDYLPKAHLVLFAKAGHLPFLSQTTDFIQRVGEFYDRCLLSS